MLQKPTKVILVTGFTPFNGEKINPSWQIVKALPETISGYRIEKLRVPTAFGKSIKTVTNAIDKFHPQIVLCMGQAGGRACMSVERVAINVDDASIADNAGVQPIDTAIYPDAPAAYFCTLPIKAMVDAMQKKGVPAEVSNTAGTFVCNHLIYGVLHYIATHQLPTRAGFVHVPFLDSHAVNHAVSHVINHAVNHEGTPSLSVAAMIDGTKAAIMAAIKNRTDIHAIGGKLH